MTEQEADEFTTALSVRYKEVASNHSKDDPLVIIWSEAISALPPELKFQFEQKYSEFLTL
ncbi:hypothetical protein [Paenibacillus sp. FSL K6-1230]|uniref:hypothetical protein n=1 Tax=Paenibacillus sp. FSL K6-1230 TaxID=2921603 RepID=UPI0030F4EC50